MGSEGTGERLFLGRHVIIGRPRLSCFCNAEQNNSSIQRKSLLCFRWDVFNRSGNSTAPSAQRRHKGQGTLNSMDQGLAKQQDMLWLGDSPV